MLYIPNQHLSRYIWPIFELALNYTFSQPKSMIIDDNLLGFNLYMNWSIIKQFMGKVNGVVLRMMKYRVCFLYGMIVVKSLMSRPLYWKNPFGLNFNLSLMGWIKRLLTTCKSSFGYLLTDSTKSGMRLLISLLLAMNVSSYSTAEVVTQNSALNSASFVVSGRAPEFYPNLGGDFELEGAHGNHTLSALEGEWKLLSFGFSHCPDICSMLLAKMNQIYQKVSAEPEALGVVFISVDAARDGSQEGLQRLQAFVARFNEQFVGLSGSEAAIAKVTKQYAVYYDSEQDTINHTDRIFLVNARGQVKKLYSRTESVDAIAADLAGLL